MEERFERTALLLGQDKMERLKRARVIVFGVGGVGGYVVEALARSGIGSLDLVDNDVVSVSNMNRQIIATDSTVGQLKVEAAKQRILDINPDCRVTTHAFFYLPETGNRIDMSLYDYVVDAIDTVSGKLFLIRQAKEHGVPVISSMGAGNKLDPTRFEVADIKKTSVCPLAKVMRRELKKCGISDVKVVYSKEPPITPIQIGEAVPPASGKQQTPDGEAVPPAVGKRQTPGSVAFVPAVAGLILAGEVIKDLCERNNQTDVYTD